MDKSRYLKRRKNQIRSPIFSDCNCFSCWFSMYNSIFNQIIYKKVLSSILYLNLIKKRIKNYHKIIFFISYSCIIWYFIINFMLYCINLVCGINFLNDERINCGNYCWNGTNFFKEKIICTSYYLVIWNNIGSIHFWSFRFANF